MFNSKEKAALLSIVSNTVLVLTKLAAGIMTGAVSIVSEGAHSAIDLLASLIAYVAVRQASRPPDEDHAYGHGKIESVSAAVEAILILVAAVWIVAEAVDKLTNPHQPEMLHWGIAIMVLSIIVNYAVSSYLLKVARETESDALEADAMHLRADIWTSISVLVGLTVIYFTGLTWLDPLIAIAVAGIIFKVGYQMTMKSFRQLTDVTLPAEEEQAIARIVSRHPQVLNFHRLRSRRVGSRRYVDVHLVMHKDISLDAAHTIGDALEAEIRLALGIQTDVVLHFEPCSHHAELVACQGEPPCPHGKDC